MRHHLALPVDSARDISTGRSVELMDSFDLEPRYSTSQIPGKCIKYLAEGKKVTLKLSFADGKPKYELKVN